MHWKQTHGRCTQIMTHMRTQTTNSGSGNSKEKKDFHMLVIHSDTKYHPLVIMALVSANTHKNKNTHIFAFDLLKRCIKNKTCKMINSCPAVKGSLPLSRTPVKKTERQKSPYDKRHPKFITNAPSNWLHKVKLGQSLRVIWGYLHHTDTQIGSSESRKQVRSSALHLHL